MRLNWGLFAGKSKAKKLFCSFCGKNTDAVKAMIAGPAVSICNECVVICNEVLADPTPARSKPRRHNYSEEYLLSVLALSSANAEAGSELLRGYVDTLRKHDVPWADIGQALGISRQAAWERFR
jgi:ribosome-binding protein aMBF1 (putative translation factor)